MTEMPVRHKKIIKMASDRSLAHITKRTSIADLTVDGLGYMRDHLDDPAFVGSLDPPPTREEVDEVLAIVQEALKEPT